MLIKIIIILAVFLFYPPGGAKAAEAKKISLPIVIEYPLLRSMLAARAFPEPGEKITLVHEGGGCVGLSAAQPQISEVNGKVRLEVLIKANAGTPIGGECYTPLEWHGYLVFYQQPTIHPASWQLSFVTEYSEVLDTNRQPAKVAALLWNMIEPQITSYLSGIKIDLLPPVNEIKTFLSPLFPADRRNQTQAMLDSMIPSQIDAGKTSLDISVLLKVASIFAPESSAETEPLSQEQLQRTVSVWEQWDGLLMYLVTNLSRQTLTDNEKRSLIDILLDTRHQFISEMADRTIQHDIVRQQFVRCWQVLSPIFKRHLLQDSELSQSLGYLAFVSSANALLVFDSLGPTLGVEISTAGLVRLMHMLNASPELLQYHRGVNPELQKLFQFQQDDENNSPAAPSSKSAGSSSSGLLKRILWPLYGGTAYAAESVPKFADILKWKVPDGDVADYVRSVGEVLKSSALSVVIKSNVPKARQKMYGKLITAMAWQESCFRQFVVKGEQLTYLLSYNQSSVGLMQVNERIWRGLYDRNRLRWDIRYNARAGCEIAAHYMNKYGLRDAEGAKSINDDTLARLVYAMYNGGPSQYKKFFQRLNKKKFYDSDALFWDKYLLVKAEKVDQVSVCLIGG